MLLNIVPPLAGDVGSERSGRRRRGADSPAIDQTTVSESVSTASAAVLPGGSSLTAPVPTNPGQKKSDGIWDDFGSDWAHGVGEVWKGYGDPVADAVTGLWNAIRHPINTAKGVYQGAAHLARNPGGVLKAIGKQIADDFTGVI